MMHNPYANVQWNTDQTVLSTTHLHMKEADFDRVYNRGLRHFMVSNYEVPFFPLAEHIEDVPEDVLESRNLEHHTMNNSNIHITAPGSTFVPTIAEPWQTRFASILGELEHSDGGGIVIAHPTRSSLTASEIVRFLDFDSRVLGIEIYNNVDSDDNNNPRGWSLTQWDKILSTGRKCYGFAVPDHSARVSSEWWGCNVLLTPTYSASECLKAYRDGRFWASVGDNTLKVTNIAVTAAAIQISYSRSCVSEIFTNGERVRVLHTQNITIPINGNETYIRVQAYIGDEKIFLQPIMFKTAKQVRSERLRKIMIV